MVVNVHTGDGLVRSRAMFSSYQSLRPSNPKTRDGTGM